MIEGLTTAFEVKISRHLYSPIGLESKYYRKKGRSSTGLVSLLRKSEILRRTKPLVECFGHDPGFVAIIPSDLANTPLDSMHYYSSNLSPEITRQLFLKTLEDFKQSGGLLVPFYTDRQTYREEVEKIREKYKL